MSDGKPKIRIPRTLCPQRRSTPKEYLDSDKESHSGPSTQEDSGLVLATKLLPSRIPILGVRQRPFFPGLPVPHGDHGASAAGGAEQGRGILGSDCGVGAPQEPGGRGNAGKPL